MNGFGQVTQETLGNGVVTNRAFDAVTSWLKSATAGVGGGASLLNQSYLQDENGNVIQRQDGVHSLTESFNYDADNRLTCVALSSTCSASTFIYDAGSAGPGNITTQAGVGTYTYPAAGQPRPHAVTSLTGTFNGITNPAFSYDANGNMIDRASSGQNIYWYSFNYPLSISGTDTTGSEEVQFQYGPDRQRWKQLYTGPSTTETTYYVGNGGSPAAAQLEVVTSGGITTYRYYINAGSEPIAVYSRSSSGNAMNYMLEDHQGGVSSFASSAGVLDIDESFSAFGQRRNPSSWSGAPVAGDLTTIAGLSRQGYTFQTWLGQSMGLNHMNGRVEDAILGRFLSPDPHIPDPTDSQSYNRFSYVRNNPLSRIDPTGFEDDTLGGDLDIAGSAGGGVILLVLGLDAPISDAPPIDVSTPDLPPTEGGDNGFGNSGSTAGSPGIQNAVAGNSGPGTTPAAQSQGSTQSQMSDSTAGAAQSGLGLTQDQWSQLSQAGVTPLADPTPAGQPVPGALTPDQIQNANDIWSDVAAAEAQLAADRAAYNANPNGQNWSAVASDAAQAAAFLQRWYTAIGQSGSPLPSPLNGQEPVSP
jgi:RHS repeat-associated protein